MSSAEARPVVFSDVDETIIRGKSLVEFLRHQPGHEPILGELLALLKDGVPRSEVNRIYYERVLKDARREELRRRCEAWFCTAARRSDFLKHEIVALLKRCQIAGAELVLVTGSFRELVDPLRDMVGPFDVLGAPLEERQGVYTGRLLGPASIGEGKALLVSHYAEQRGIDLNRCLGIGDDLSDGAFLDLLGHKVVPSDGSPELLARARAEGWQIVQVPGGRESSAQLERRKSP